ncbi:Abi-alpha family protein [Aequorivita sp. SDUM287046]|uniref:Abi-alpha family protein n=1 Tax=Aequorivita aurantiaca TaxID=3053356 RepID=A0ABT8DN36_9FLAO|nr:Abi-alpha family protein [Aequorivita aurantiaca]MDN3724565.1 Abi-alpha family protein [Aequorivita aurantiaca]
MSDKELNIKSSTIEKGLDLAKDFLGKLIFPAVEEVGLLMGDNIKVWRFKNQIRLLNNVEKYVNEKNISTKKVPLKILLPLLENASLEEDPILNKMWENLLINYIDSNKLFTISIFPMFLSQLSTREATFLKHLIILVKEYDLSGEKLKLYENDFRGVQSLNIPDAEISNMVRLGIIGWISGIDILTRCEFNRPSVSNKEKYIYLTKLGEEFIQACSIK